MKLEGIEIDEKKLKAIAMDAALQVAKGEIDKSIGVWHSANNWRAIISRTVDEAVSRLLASDEFKNEVESFCRERFMLLAEKNRQCSLQDQRQQTERTGAVMAAPSVSDAERMGAGGPEAMGIPHDESERLAFEAYMRGHCWEIAAKWDGTAYLSKCADHLYDNGAMITRMLWAVWRDRAALAALKAKQHKVRQYKDFSAMDCSRARAAREFLASFNGQSFGISREERPNPHDGRHLGIALDYIEELSAMVLCFSEKGKQS